MYLLFVDFSDHNPKIRIIKAILTGIRAHLRHHAIIQNKDGLMPILLLYALKDQILKTFLEDLKLNQLYLEKNSSNLLAI